MVFLFIINDIFSYQSNYSFNTTFYVNGNYIALRNNQDFHARIGGEEFAIILQGISSEDLTKVIERILTNVSSVIIKANVDVQVTCSVGSTLATCNSNVTMKKMMILADQALYKAKSNGRNQAYHLPYNDSLLFEE